MNNQSVVLARYAAIINFASVAALVLLTLVSTQGCVEEKEALVEPGAKETNLAEVAILSDLIKSEDLILDLTPQLSRIAAWYELRSHDPSLPLPPELSTCVSVSGLAAASADQVFHQDSNHADFVEVGHWPIVESPAEQAVDPWQSAMALNALWETMKFGAIAGNFSESDKDVFVINTKVEARGKSAPDDSTWLYGLKAYQSLEFQKEAGEWILKKWTQEDFYIERSRQPLFEEVLADVLKDPGSLANAQRSFLDEIILKTAQTGVYDLPENKYSKWTTMTSDHVYPSVSVVDFNNDGWDDIFLTARWGPTQMLKNLGDGTFVDVAESVGLKVEYLVNCVLFVDLDNDANKLNPRGDSRFRSTAIISPAGGWGSHVANELGGTTLNVTGTIDDSYWAHYYRQYGLLVDPQFDIADQYIPNTGSLIYLANIPEVDRQPGQIEKVTLSIGF